MPRPLLLLLGDSITEFGVSVDNGGWIALLLQRFNRTASIHQTGLAGYTTKWYMDVVFDSLKKDLSTTLSPSLITLWLGANDAALPDGPSFHQHVPLEDYKKNLHALVAMFKQTAPQAKILLITPPPVDDEARRRMSKTGKLDRSNAAAGEYAKACKEVAAAEKIEALDLYTYFNAFPTAERNACLIDGLHLSKKGNALMEQQLCDKIKASYPDLQKRLEHPEYPGYHDDSMGGAFSGVTALFRRVSESWFATS
ncbi:hypothetical protein PINS_up013863 [Pythium insidiosum]|nr:hypothetical protein PINS_up013863 [Pythium insidiosum]